MAEILFFFFFDIRLFWDSPDTEALVNLKAGGPIDGCSINTLSEEDSSLQFPQHRMMVCEDKSGEDVVK